MKILVLKSLYNAFKKVLNVRNRKLEKHGLEPIAILSKSESLTTVKHPELGLVQAECYIVELSDNSVYSGWKIIGILKKDDDVVTVHGNDEIIKSSNVFSRVECGNLYCDHCGTFKPKKKAYVVENSESSELKIIGSGCLDLYIDKGFRNFADGYLDFLNRLESGEFSDGSKIGMNDVVFDIEDVLSLAISSIKSNGYSNSSSEFPTADHVRTQLLYGSIPSGNMDEVNAMLSWIRGMDLEDVQSNQYMMNLWSVCSKDSVSYRNVGLVVSLPVAYEKAMQVVDSKGKSSHLGNVGEVLELSDVKVVKLIGIDTRYGYSYLVIMEKDGNVLTWFTRNPKCSVGDVVKVKGRVKEHSEYNGILQTVLTRCKLEIIG